MGKRVKKKSSRQWIDRHVTDPYVKRAQQEGYRARSAYKLIEIDDAEKLLRRGLTVVELGAAPGAWTQVLARRVLPADRTAHSHGQIVTMDLLEMDPVVGVTSLQGDFREQASLDALVQALAGRSIDLIVSDMSPNLSGIAVADSARMTDLIELTLAFALDHLNDNGILLAKTFHGSGYSQQVEQFKFGFVKVKAKKPSASRPESAETYLLARTPKRRHMP